MDRGVEEPLASALGALAVPGILWDVGDQARIENVRAIACGIKATIEVEIRASEVQPHLFGHAFQRFQTIREQDHIRFIDWRDGEGSQDITMVLRYGYDFVALLVFVPRVANPIAPFLATVLVPSPCSML